jgi:hypothetical protein
MLWGSIMNFRKLHRHGHVACLITDVYILWAKKKEDPFNISHEEYYRICNRPMASFRVSSKLVLQQHYIFMTGMWDACLFDYVLFCLFLSRTSKLIGIQFFACNLVQYKNSPDCTFKKIQIFFCHDSGDIIFCTDFLQSLPWVDVDQRPVPKWRIFLITPGPFHQPLQHIKS